MPTVDFLPYATGMGANVESQLAYSTDPTTAGGQLAGIAKSSIFNKIWRQGNFFAAVLANFIANQLGVSVLDDGDVSGKITLFQNAIIQLCSTVFAPITSPNFLGVPTAPTVAGTSDNSTKIATTGFVQAVRALLAPLASPAFTGTPTAPTPSAGDNSTKLATTAFVQSEGVPVGASIIWNASSPPANYLEENGASLSTSTYATLFAAIGYTFGGAGASFNLPDSRGEFVRGWDDGRGVDPARTLGSTQAAALGSHSHNTGIGAIDNTAGIYGFTAADVPGAASACYQKQSSAPTAQEITSSTGGAETRPTNIAKMFCIKYR